MSGTEMAGSTVGAPVPSEAVGALRPIPAPWAYRTQWVPELVAVALVAAVCAMLFAGTDLDLRIAALFHGGGSFQRPLELAPLWVWLYRGAPVLVAAIAVGCAAVLLAGARNRRWRSASRAAAFVLLAYAVGPGLIVNVGFKNFWGRPRPVQVREFGGQWAYQDVARRGTPGRGKSFPCGHSSAGYALTAFWLVWKRHRPRRAVVALGVALALGTALGIGRMVTGSHFASDVLASGLVVHLANVVLYYFVMNVPGREDTCPGPELPLRISRGAAAGWGLLGAGVAGASLLATPYYAEFRHAPGQSLSNGARVCLRLPPAEVALTLREGAALEVRGVAEGFGMFHSRLLRGWTGTGERCEFTMGISGWFTDLAITMEAVLPAGVVSEVAVEMPRGELAVDRPAVAPWRVELGGVGARRSGDSAPAPVNAQPSETRRVGQWSARIAPGG
ncbi:MAG: phosphatase PAP2 family protein [Kiritimatiellae bacterium]|nr:phosphatase PAP2 family protein [Kiritimatiellia bacterium]